MLFRSLKQFRKGDTRYDANGNVILTQAAQNVYGVQMVQFDARLFASQDASDEAYVSALPATFAAKAHALDSVRSDLGERTYMYYRPYRTIGTATWGIGDGNTAVLPLATSYSVTYYVIEAVLNNATLTDEIKSDTVTLINAYTQDNTTLSIATLTQLITAQFGDNIVSADLSGIFRNDSYKTIALQDKGVSPSVAKLLVMDPNGSLYLTPDITITFVLDPSVTTS